MPTPEFVIVAVLVGVLGAFHLLQRATASPHPSAPVTVGEALRHFVRGTDPVTRALLISALVALSFAGLAPLLRALGHLVGA